MSRGRGGRRDRHDAGVLVMPGRMRITDHALVRWLDRTGSFDVERVRAALAASLERCVDAAEKIGEDDYVIVADGLTYLVRDRALITVTKRLSRKARR
jgi:hypothetical protein